MYAFCYKELVKKIKGIEELWQQRKKEKWIVKLLKIVVAIYLLLVLCQLIGDAYSRLSVAHKITVSEEMFDAAREEGVYPVC